MGEPERDKTLFSSGVHHLPLPRGKFKVGSVDVLNGVSRNRGCLFRVFYPCEEQFHICPNAADRTTWLPQPQAKYAAGYAKVQGNLAYATHKLLGSQAASLYIGATSNAKPVRENRNAFPVILFSHDIGECRTTSSSLCIELASHGCVVAALEHRDNTASKTFYVRPRQPGSDDRNEVDGISAQAEETDEPLRSDDEIPMCESALDDEDENQENDSLLANSSEDETDTAVKLNYKQPGNNETIWVNYRPIEKTPDLLNVRTRQLHRRVGECIRTLNCLERINLNQSCRNELAGNRSEELRGIMDMDRITVIGRGFGGSTAYITLQLEDRTVCGAAIDPLMYVIRADRPIKVSRPFLLVLNSRHTARQDVEIMRTMFAGTPYTPYTTPYNLQASEGHAQTDLPFIRLSSLWSSLSLSWPMVAPSAFTTLDIGTTLILKFISDKCNFCGHNREFYEDYVQRKSNLIVKGFKMPSRWFSRYSNAR